jgi:hypothetical protein
MDPKEKLAAWMISNSLATGHGDSLDDLFEELDWQFREIRAENARLKKQNDEPNHFSGLLAVLKDEELIRLRRRLEKRSNLTLASILADELEEREGIEKANLH